MKKYIVLELELELGLGLRLELELGLESVHVWKLIIWYYNKSKNKFFSKL